MVNAQQRHPGGRTCRQTAVYLLTVVLAILAVGGVGGAAIALAATSHTAASHTAPAHHVTVIRSDVPPECVTAQIVNPSNQIAYVKGCGGAGGQESPWQDWLANSAREPVVLDGITAITPANCPKLNPCVMLAVNAPQS